MNKHRITIETAPRTIECLCCGTDRVMIGREGGECPRCHYVGWTYADELDGFTRRLIENRAFGVGPAHHPGLGAPSLAAGS